MLPESLSNHEGAKSAYITMELKSTAGADGSGKYKKHLALFEEGTPQEWIDTQRAIMEVWTQNSIESPADRVAIVKSVLRGESLTTFDAAIADGMKNAEGNTV